MTLTATLLIVCGRANFTNLGRYSDLNEKTYRRHYAESIAFEDIHRALIDAASSPSAERIAVNDCTFVNKSGKKTEGLGFFYNGSHSKSERGLEWSVVSIVDMEQNTGYTLHAQQTPAELSNSEKEAGETRTDWYLKQIQQVRSNLPDDIKYLASDAYYSKKKWVDGILKLDLHVIGKLRCDSRLSAHPKIT